MFVVVSSTGCGPTTEVRLIQPRTIGWQRDIQLLSDQVYWAPGESAERVLAQFPLPGATTGKATYLLYLRLPPGQEELVAATGAPSAVRGFFVQTRGEYAGLVNIVRGTITVKGKSKSAAATRKLLVDLTCEDDTRIEGHLLAKRHDWYMNEFETQHHPADVQALLATPSTQPAGQAK